MNCVLALHQEQSNTPDTVHSSSMCSETDDEMNMVDISSSAQTSTVSPNKRFISSPTHRISHSTIRMINNEGKAADTNSRDESSNLNDFSFYQGSTAMDSKKQASHLRRSIVISSSFNTIASRESINLDNEMEVETDSLMDNVEIPTKNIGMVFSPSIKALSDILTSKVTLNGSLQQLVEEDEEDDDFENQNASPYKQVSLIDDMYTPDQNSSSKLTDNDSNDTLNVGHNKPNNLVDTQTVGKNDAEFDQPNLIDLSSPQVNDNSFMKNANPNYSDIYESYSPNKNTTTDDTPPNYRFSMISDNFNDFKSPELGYNEPVESFNFINPSITKSFSKLSNLSDSVHEIGYDNETNSYNVSADDSNAFSFVPTRTSTINRSNSMEKRAIPQNKINESESGFIQRHQPRLSIRIVKEEDDKTPFINEYIISASATPKVSGFHFDENTTPVLHNVPDLKCDSNPVTPNLDTHNNSEMDTPKSLNKSPIRNTSPILEQIKNSPTISVNKKVIDLSTDTKHKPNNVKSVERNKKYTIPKSPDNSKLPECTIVASKNANTVSKPKKLTFKSFFGISNNNNDSSPKTETKKSRPKSFSFNTLNNSKENMKKEERKVKSRSLLSGWKRKSVGNSSTFGNNTTMQEPQLPKPQKSPKSLSSPKLSSSPKSKIFSHYRNKSSPHMEVSPNMQPTGSPRNNHQHSKSEPVSEVLYKSLPNLPPPIASDELASNNKGLLSTYGFDQVTPQINQGPIISRSPDPEIINSFSHSPQHKILRSESEQTIETKDIPRDLNINPQSAEVGKTTPNIVDDPFNVEDNHYVSDAEPNSGLMESSSIYDTTGNRDETFISRKYKENEPGIESYTFKPPQPIALGVTILDKDMPKTPKENQTSPAISLVASFTASPNKYHIGDDMFPKKLGIEEIESIISLERSRSLRSIRSNKSYSNRNSIIKRVQENNNNFTEMKLPDGMVVVKSPKTEHTSNWNANEITRTTSILKNSVSYNDFESPAKPQEVLKSPIRNRDSILYDDELNGMIDMINFDDDDFDANLINLNFDIDTNMNIQFTPVQSENKPNVSRDASVQDFLGIETTYDSMHFDDYNDDFFNQSFTPDPPSDHIYSKSKKNESIEDIIKEEEEFQNFDFQPPSKFNAINKGLNGPSFNSNVKPEPQNTGLDTSKNVSIELAESEHSLSHFDQSSYNDYANYYDGDTFSSPVASLKKDQLYQAPQSLSHSLQLNTSPLQQTYHQSYQPNVSSSLGQYSYKNTHDYTQNYDDDQFENNNYNDNDNNNGYVNHVDYENFGENAAEIGYENKFSDISNRRKSLSFMDKLNNNQFSSLPVESVQTPTKTEKPKKLTRRKQKSSNSIGSKLSLFDSFIPSSEKVNKKNVTFSSRILLYETYDEDEYDRKPDSATCNNLTPQLAMEIKAELNEVKSEMEVHSDSMCYTHFF